MPDASVNLAPTPDSAPAPEPASPSWHGISRAGGSPRPGRPQRRRRRWLSWLRVIALVVLLPVVALGVGLLVAWIVHQVRGNPSVAPRPSSPAPSPSAAATTPHPTATPHAVTVPADWVSESDPPAGLTFRHPPGWIRRTALPEILRFAPASTGSTTPGIEGIGAGIEPTADPAAAIQQFVSRAYGGQPQVHDGTVTAVAGSHPGERQEVVTYVRGGVPVRVVVHAYTSGGKSVIVLARAAGAQPARAAELEAAIEASVQLTG